MGIIWFTCLIILMFNSDGAKGLPQYKNPPPPPKQRKCVGIVHGRRLYR